MKIVNETCYSTEDLETLSERVIQTLEMLHRDATNTIACSPIWHQDKTVRFGYFTPSDKPTPEKSNPLAYAMCYTSIRRIRTTSPRIGIVKKGLLHNSALMALASAALDEATAPNVLVQEITLRIVEVITGYSTAFTIQGSRWADPGDAIKKAWAWVYEFKLRYRDRAKRGSRAEAKYAKLKLELDLSRKAITAARINVLDYERVLAEARAEYCRVIARSDDLEAKLREFAKQSGINHEE